MAVSKGNNQLTGPAAPWTPDLKTFIIKEKAKGQKPSHVWKIITDESFEKEFHIKGPHKKAKFRTFLNRWHKIPVEEVAIARQEWKNNFDDLYYSSKRGRVETLSRMAKKLEDAVNEGNLDTEILAEVRKTLTAIRQEMNADADREALANSGSILIANPKEVKLDITLIKELIMTMRNDVGGIKEIIDFSILQLHELEEIKKAVDEEIKKTIDGLQETEIIEEDDDDEN